ncbi:hypothetical protein WJX81_002050 [Elliptochloris bilobata]|uniref:NAD(P)-binding domain-containing protein n=1 Tax=Elliptochloris bilobata TaxID=381761 RepID=A0AAW1SCY5_9CHLO
MDAVIGAGGPTGLECVKRLAQLGRPVQAIIRSPDKYTDLFSGLGSNVTAVKGDVESSESLTVALAGVKNIIFAASGKGYWSARAVDELGVGAVAEAAKAVGVKHIVLVSSALVSPHNRCHPIRLILNNIRWGLMDSKYRGENLLRKSGITYTVVRPGGLTNGPALTEELVVNQGDRVAGRVSRADVAAVAVAALSDPRAANVTLELSSKSGAVPPANQLSSLFKGLAKD